MSFLRGLRPAGRSGFTGTESSDAEGSLGRKGSLSTGFAGGRWLVVLTGGDDEQNSGDVGRVCFGVARFDLGMRDSWMELFLGSDVLSSAESISITSCC